MGAFKKTFTDTSSASYAAGFGQDFSTTSEGAEIHGKAILPARPSDDAIAAAVYNYISAVRALGRTQINTKEIAEALRLDRSAVEATIDSLILKNVKVIDI